MKEVTTRTDECELTVADKGTRVEIKIKDPNTQKEQMIEVPRALMTTLVAAIDIVIGGKLK